MKDLVVWLDSKNARVYKLNFSNSENLAEHITIHKSDVDHHTRHKNDKRSDSSDVHFNHEIALKLKDVGRLLLMGPGRAKNDFRSHLESHHANDLSKKVIGVENYESFEHKSEKQMIAMAKKFFINKEQGELDDELF